MQTAFDHVDPKTYGQVVLRPEKDGKVLRFTLERPEASWLDEQGRFLNVRHKHGIARFQATEVLSFHSWHVPRELPQAKVLYEGDF